MGDGVRGLMWAVKGPGKARRAIPGAGVFSSSWPSFLEPESMLRIFIQGGLA